MSGGFPPSCYWLDDRPSIRYGDDVDDWAFVPPADPIDTTRIVWAHHVDHEAPEPSPEAMLDAVAAVRGREEQYRGSLLHRLHLERRRLEHKRHDLERLRERAWRAYGIAVERTAFRPAAYLAQRRLS